MQMALKVLAMMLIGGFIGYSTNVLAVKLLFRPIIPFRIPLIGLEVIGLIPKRREEIARTIGETVQNDLLSSDEILRGIVTEKDKEEVKAYLRRKIEKAILDKSKFIPSFFMGSIFSYVDDVLDKEADLFMNEVESQMMEKAKGRIDIKAIVEEKINSFDLYYLENMILKIASKELRHIEMLGFVLGLLIGAVQGLLLMV